VKYVTLHLKPVLTNYSPARLPTPSGTKLAGPGFPSHMFLSCGTARLLTVCRLNTCQLACSSAVRTFGNTDKMWSSAASRLAYQDYFMPAMKTAVFGDTVGHRVGTTFSILGVIGFLWLSPLSLIHNVTS